LTFKIIKTSSIIKSFKIYFQNITSLATESHPVIGSPSVLSIVAAATSTGSAGAASSTGMAGAASS
jgi:hypothetical protein